MNTDPKIAGLTHRIEYKQWLDEDAERLNAMPPHERMREQLVYKKAALRRASRRAQMERHALTTITTRYPGKTTLAADLIKITADIAQFAHTPDVITAAAYNPELAQDVANLQARAKALVDEFATILPSITEHEKSLVSYLTPDGAVTASMQTIDPEVFVRKVRARRRKAELERAKAQRRSAKVAKCTPRARTGKANGKTLAASAAPRQRRDPMRWNEQFADLKDSALTHGEHCTHDRLSMPCPRESEAKRRARDEAADKTELNRAVRLAEEADRRRKRDTLG